MVVWIFHFPTSRKIDHLHHFSGNICSFSDNYKFDIKTIKEKLRLVERHCFSQAKQNNAFIRKIWGNSDSATSDTPS